MTGSGYKLLGWTVWRGGRWYLRRNFGRRLPSRRTASLLLLAAGIGAAALIGRRAASS